MFLLYVRSRIRKWNVLNYHPVQCFPYPPVGNRETEKTEMKPRQSKCRKFYSSLLSHQPIHLLTEIHVH